MYKVVEEMKRGFLCILLAILVFPTSINAYSKLIKIPKFYDLDVLSIPKGYYEKEYPLPNGVDIIEWLTEYRWTDAYEENKFDCSQMSLFTEWVLEVNGYDTKILVGTLDSEGHMWLEISMDGESYWYEATGRYFIYDKRGYSAERRFYTIRDWRLWIQNEEDFSIESAWWYDEAGQAAYDFYIEYSKYNARQLEK